MHNLHTSSLGEVMLFTSQMIEVALHKILYINITMIKNTGQTLHNRTMNTNDSQCRSFSVITHRHRCFIQSSLLYMALKLSDIEANTFFKMQRKPQMYMAQRIVCRSINVGW